MSKKSGKKNPNNLSFRRILWLEDRPDTIGAEAEYIDAMPNLKLELCPSLTELYNNLQQWETESETYPVAAIILDIQVFGATSLQPFIKDRPIQFLPNQAGRMLAEHVLREKGSKYRDIPLLFFTIQSISQRDKIFVEKLNNRGESVQWIEKRSSSVEPMPSFVEWVEKLSSALSSLK
ncbi:MAG: hypothetical protein HQL69_24180 [Magnetococcales bacterium]|nr:hypothetical protein [Magnetococcales bacterium]